MKKKIMTTKWYTLHNPVNCNTASPTAWINADDDIEAINV